MRVKEKKSQHTRLVGWGGDPKMLSSREKRSPYHVGKIDEGIVDGNDLDVLVGKSSAENETTDASESE